MNLAKKTSAAVLGVAILAVADCASRLACSQEYEVPWWQLPPYLPSPTEMDYYGERSQLVAVGKVIGRVTSGPLPTKSVHIPPRSVYYRVEVLYVLKGQEKRGDVLLLWGETPHLPIWVARSPRRGLFFLNRLREGCYVVAGFPPFLAPPPEGFQIPREAPIKDKIVLLAIARFHDSEDDANRALNLLDPAIANVDSPYYDVMKILHSIPVTSSSLYVRALTKRMAFGDAAALDEATELTRNSPQPRPRWSFRGLEGEDVVTTLNLVLEGKVWPWMNDSRAGALGRLAEIAHPSSLPHLMAVLDHPDARWRYTAFKGIERIRGRRPVTPMREFFDRSRSSMYRADSPLSENGTRLINEMKQWWQNEGKRQFDYVLPEEK